MNINEMQRHRKELEQKILSEIASFEDRTGVGVSGIDLSFVECARISSDRVDRRIGGLTISVEL